MKEILKSKMMILFLGLIIGVLYINAMDIQKMETEKNAKENVYVAMNA